MQQALSAFEAEDYARPSRTRAPSWRAIQARRGAAASASGPGAAAAAVSDGIKRAQALFDQGKFEEASRAAVRSAERRARQRRREAASWRTGRRARAVAARRKPARRWREPKPPPVRPARSGFAPAPTRRPSPPNATPSACIRGERPGDATVKFYEASGLFRSAEVAAQNESAAREALARPAPAPAPQPPPAGAHRRNAGHRTRLPSAAAAAGRRRHPSGRRRSPRPSRLRPPPLPPPAAAPPAPAPSPAEAPARATDSGSGPD